ncbi:MAG: gamma-glutamyl-gamma-aminobutyrate hydrolase family protein [Alphaproteobacteria bacterium]|nr:gamma-glutamyl-gamma-aminobutyrate hydrolase family protein [Alphaproteobacteria bacterium]
MGAIRNWLNKLFGGGQPEVVADAPSAAPVSTPESTLPTRPVIAISGEKSSSKSVAAMMTQIRSSGAEPVFIGDHAARIAGGVQEAVVRDLSRVDGLVVLGNDDDIDPAKYGQKTEKNTHVEAPERAAYEEAAIQFALGKKMPLVTVCAGMQRLNVLGGGTLHQSVPDLVGDNHHNQGDIAPFIPVQLVKLEEGSKLLQISDAVNGVYTPTRSPLLGGVIAENSFHHQAVDKVRPDFVASARSDDGIIEAIEPARGSKYDGQFVVGVQWHPEFGASDFGPKLAASFTTAAAQYSKVKDNVPTLMGLPLETSGEHAQKLMSSRGRSFPAPAAGANPQQPSLQAFQ